MLTAFLINCAVAWALAPSTLLAHTTLACRRAVGLALSELKVTTFAPTASPSASGVSPLRQRLAQLARIAEEHGVAAPSVQFGHDASLVRWATRQRTLRRQGSLSQDVIDQLDMLERDVQDERENTALMFPNAGVTIAAMKSQGRLFSSADLYRDAADKSDMGAECGLFCNR
jgi:hypothetical protein